ncbi:MAG TPA: DNA repair protein RecN [Terriglobia bacterium]|nr:DNA repair protein RecN [Terriglobia bacterium]
MLQEIHIQNYAVIESLRVDFHPGLNVLTGETGSGKSIVVDALALALGGRASPDVIRTGADRATVTVVFRTEVRRGGNHRAGGLPWTSWLDRYGVGGAADEEIMLRREIQAGGRSRLLVNDEPVTLATVKDLAPLLVEVHGQGEHAALLLREAQLDLLDAFARTGERLAEVGALHERRRELELEWTRLNQSEQERLQALDLLRFQVEELSAARLQPGEDERLESERAVLRNLEKVRSAAAAAHAALYEDEGSALSRLAAVERALDDLARYDRALESNRESLSSARAALDDLSRALGDYIAGLEVEPGRLEEVEDRLALLDRLKRKYGSTVDEMLAFAERARLELSRLERADERREEVRRSLEQAREAYAKAAGGLSHERRQSAGRLAREVHRELAQLGMEKARFEVRFEDASAGAEPEPNSSAGGPKGIDRITFLVSSNPGEEVRPLDRVASGGELSRLMLALKTVIAGLTAGGNPVSRTLVFDEVDAGIGGRVAECVGERLKRLSKQNQVLCVTHLPQIACFADHHYSVEKIERGGRTFAEVQYLPAERERAAELARMLSGRKVTEAVLEHAAAMLKQGRGS